MYAVAIDLGTTNSCIAVYNSYTDQIEIVQNKFNSRTNPSVIAFDKDTGQRFIGHEAKGKTNSIYEIKRVIGRLFTDPKLKDEIKTLNYKIHQKDNRPIVKVEYTCNGTEITKSFSPEEISAMILENLKIIAETYIGEPIRDVIICIPAFFNDFQRQATKDAATIAGLNVKRLLSEPVAAAMSYGLHGFHGMKTETILVFDLGGGTFDVSLLSLNNGLFEVLAISGDTNLGGKDFDNILVKWAVSQFKKTTKKTPGKDAAAMKKLHRQCIILKETLSSSIEGSILIENFYSGFDLNVSLTRSEFETLCNPLFARLTSPIEKVLNDSGIGKDDVDEIILVGGSSRIPYVQELVSKLFNGKNLNKQINVDEAVAQGACIQASILAGIKSEKTQNVLLLDVNPLSLGIEIAGNQMSTIIKRNTKIPHTETNTFSTYSDNQESVKIKIYEGERSCTKDNNFLGTFDLQGIPKMLRGEPKIDITFEINCDGILKVSANVRNVDTGNSLIINKNQGHLTRKQIEKMIKEAEEFREQDQIFMENLRAKNKFESFIFNLKRDLIASNTPCCQTLKNTDYDKLLSYVIEVIHWLEQSTVCLQSEIYIEKLVEVQNHELYQIFRNENLVYCEKCDDYTPHS